MSPDRVHLLEMIRKLKFMKNRCNDLTIYHYWLNFALNERGIWVNA